MDNDSRMNDSVEEDSEMSPAVSLELSVPLECRLSIQQRQLPLISRIFLVNNALSFSSLKVVAKFDLLDIESYEWSLDPVEFSIDSAINLSVPEFGNPNEQPFCISEETVIPVSVMVIADDIQIAVETVEIKLIPPVTITLDVAPVYSIVFQQNQFPLISQLEVTNNSLEAVGTTKVVAEFDPDDFESATWMIDELASGQSVRLKERQLKFSASALESLTERRLIQLKLSVYTDGIFVCSKTASLELLPKNHWGGELHMPELLSAFVTPNTNYCDELIKKASNLLAKEGYDSKLDGYQSKTRDRPYLIAAALWSAICNEGISYCVPPASFASSGQKIRFSDDISKSRLATCLDLALLFSGCLEQAGLNSVIALTKGHAMVGVWLIDESFPLLTNNDPVDLRNRVALKDLVLFETTLATCDSPVKFAQAVSEANRKVSEKQEDEFVYVLDVKQARSRKINPINGTRQGSR